jgi:hypothetical protein
MQFFTAETVLDPPGILRPAVGGPGSIDKGQCLSDCLDAGVSPAVCRRRCSLTGGPTPGGGGGGGGGVGQAACIASCEVVYGVCLADSVFLGFPGCRAARNACVNACKRNVVN